MSYNPRRSRVDELLADRALFQIDSEEQHELDQLLAFAPEEDLEAMDRLTAQITVAGIGQLESMPKSLRDRISVDIDSFRRSTQSHMSEMLDEPQFGSEPTVAPANLNSVDTSNKGRGWPFAMVASGWVVAACLLVALVLPEFYPVSTPSSSVAELRAELIGSEASLVRQAWTATEDPAGVGVTGDVVWSGERQEGYMSFENVKPIGDDKVFQLWIFDSEQDDRFPIDGGVFTVEGSNAIVPIRASLPVGSATMFAITVEDAPGVVVSSRERLPLLAKIPAEQASTGD